MNILKIILQAVGIFLLIPAVALATLRLLSSGADGPSILFPGGELVSGNLHAGPERDWSFTDQIPSIELQLNDPLSSRRIYVMESEGKLYIVKDSTGPYRRIRVTLRRSCVLMVSATNDR